MRRSSSRSCPSSRNAMEAAITTLINLLPCETTGLWEYTTILRERLAEAEELDNNVLLDNAILLAMYQNLETRKYVREFLDIILGYIFDANEEFASKKTLFNTKLETSFDNVPPLIAQLFDDIATPDSKGKTLLFYVIKEGDTTLADVILRCQGFNAVI